MMMMMMMMRSFLFLFNFILFFSLSFSLAPPGQYVQKLSLSAFRKCPQTLSISKSNSTDISSLHAHSFVVDNVHICEGNPIRFSRLVDSNLTYANIIDFYQGRVNGDLRCTTFNFSHGTPMYFVRFSARETLQFFGKDSDTSFASPEPTDFEPEQTLLPISTSSPSMSPSVSASITPQPSQSFFFRPDVYYFIYFFSKSGGCIWERIGDVISPSPSITYSMQNSSSDSNDNNINDDNNDNAPVNTSSSDGSMCFPAFATTTLHDGSIVRMDELKIGDKVFTGVNKPPSSIFAWTHQQKPNVNILYTYIRIHTTLPKPLVLTPSHYLYVFNQHSSSSSSSSSIIIPARNVQPKIHSLIDLNGNLLQVLNVDVVRLPAGLYNPQTTDGDIIVDGIQVTTFTTTFHPNTAHALLTPLRALFKSFFALTSCMVSKT